MFSFHPPCILTPLSRLSLSFYLSLSRDKGSLCFYSTHCNLPSPFPLSMTPDILYEPMHTHTPTCTPTHSHTHTPPYTHTQYRTHTSAFTPPHSVELLLLTIPLYVSHPQILASMFALPLYFFALWCIHSCCLCPTTECLYLFLEWPISLSFSLSFSLSLCMSSSPPFHATLILPPSLCPAAFLNTHIRAQHNLLAPRQFLLPPPSKSCNLSLLQQNQRLISYVILLTCLTIY